jgi:hypothetical protein
MIGTDIETLFDDDPFDHPLWRQAAIMADAPTSPAKGYVTVPWVWVSKVLPFIVTASQLAVALWLYRQCLVKRSKTVDLSNGVLRAAGISRYTKYRTLAALSKAGALTMEETPHGRSIRATLHWFP